MEYNSKTLPSFGLAFTFIFFLLLNPALAQISDIPADVPPAEAPYFYLETNFIDLDAEKKHWQI